MSVTSSTSSLASPGIGSGLDVNGLVSKLMAVEQLPLTQLNNQESSYQSEISAYGTIKGYLSAFQTAAQALEAPANFTVTKASVADATVLSATSSTTAVAGNYNVAVTQLAQAQKLASAGYASTSTAVASGTLPVTLTLNYTDTSKTAVNISIDSSNNTLTGIRDAINNANAGVSASIINDGTNNRLILSSETSGAIGAVSLSSTDAGLGALATGMTTATAAQDAKFTVDGIAIQKSSNAVTDAIQGVTLNLAKIGTSQVSVATDTASITANIQQFVSAYNSLQSSIKSNTSYDATNNNASVLTGDSTTRFIQQTIHNIFNTAVSGAPSGQSHLTDIGISFQKDGTLAVDATKLSAALANPSINVANIFAKSGSVTGYASQIDTAIGNMLGSGGLLTSRTDGLNTTIKSMESRKTALSARLATMQKTYLAQFNALDSTISSLNSTSTFLTQSLASLSASSKA